MPSVLTRNSVQYSKGVSRWSAVCMVNFLQPAEPYLLNIWRMTPVFLNLSFVVMRSHSIFGGSDTIFTTPKPNFRSGAAVSAIESFFFSFITLRVRFLPHTIMVPSKSAGQASFRNLVDLCLKIFWYCQVVWSNARNGDETYVSPGKKEEYMIMVVFREVWKKQRLYWRLAHEPQQVRDPETIDLRWHTNYYISTV